MTDHPVTAARGSRRRRLAYRVMPHHTKRDRRRSGRATFRYRVANALSHMRGWWDWGHVLMALCADYRGGNASPPEPTAWYFYEADMRRSRLGRRMRHRLVVVKSWDAMQALDARLAAERAEWTAWYRSLPEAEQMRTIREPLPTDRPRPDEPSWRVLNVQDDGAVLVPANHYPDGQNYGLNREIARLLVRYVIVEWWLKSNWLGLRTWLYFRGLHRVVDMRRPFRCNARPAPGGNAYSHWACDKRKHRAGLHGMNAMTWDENGTCTHHPELARRP